MAIARFGHRVKRSCQSYGFLVKLSAVVILGLCFVFVWSVFSNFSVTSRRDTSDDIAEPVSSSSGKIRNFQIHKLEPRNGQESDKQGFNSGLEVKEKKKLNGSLPLKPKKKKENGKGKSVGENGGDNVKLGVEEKNNENEGSEEEIIKEKGGR